MSAKKKFKPDSGNNHNILDMFKRSMQTQEQRENALQVSSENTLQQSSANKTLRFDSTPKKNTQSPAVPMNWSPTVSKSDMSRPATGGFNSPLATKYREQSQSPRYPSKSVPHTPSTPLRTIDKNNDDLPDSDDSETIQYPHLKYKFLYPPERMDIQKRKPDHPDYDEKTLYVPERFLDSQTPALRQWWLIKQRNMDAILFFKMGKFYELFNEDAAIGVCQLDINYMKGDESKPAHAGFPEVSYEKYSKILIDRGYKVIRVEQTETPAMMEDRCQVTGRKSKFDKVVAREVCRATTKGTQMLGIMESVFQSSQNQYLMAICQSDGSSGDSSKSKIFGICFVDVTIGKFNLGQFEDDHNQSKLNILLAHHKPTEVLYERGNLNSDTTKAIMKTGAVMTPLKPTKEFWPIKKALTSLKTNNIYKDDDGEYSWPKFLKELFYQGDDCQSLLALDPKEDSLYALNSFGAIVFYLTSQLIAKQVMQCATYELYETPLMRSKNNSNNLKGSTNAPPMILDHIVIRNLEIFENSCGGTKSTLFESLNHCKSHFGQRMLKNWICNPYCDIDQIERRQEAIEALCDNENTSLMTEIKHILDGTPDLERMLSKIKNQCFKSDADSRAIMFDGNQLSKMKITSFINLLHNFKRLRNFVSSINKTISNSKSKVLTRLLSFTHDEGLFPDYGETINYFETAFDHEQARRTGTITPSKGVDKAYDECDESINDIKQKLDDYLEEQKEVLRTRHIKYFGSAKSRYQIQVPETYCKNVPSEYRIETTRKGVKRYYTPTIEKLLKKLTTLEEEMKRLLDGIMSKIFEQFSRKFRLWQAAIECFAVLDVLQSIANFSRSLKASDIDICKPEFIRDYEKPLLEYYSGRHPVLVTSNSSYIPNDLLLDDRMILLSGANMGGKSTLMRQTALLVILAQIGSFVPASKMRLTPVDRIFSRLGASDRLIEGESTFYTELVETSAMLRCATNDSLLLLDELGRGTSTYDGTAIAYSVLQEISNNLKCRCLFSTHYHTLVSEFHNCGEVRLAHMACKVEKKSGDVDEIDLDPLKENITFLYKISDGPVARSYGFNVAKLAGIQDDLIKLAFVKAKELEVGCKVLESLQRLAIDEPLPRGQMKDKVVNELLKCE